MVFDTTCKSTARLDGKTAIVTGSNTGIGKCTVQDFYRRGARVIMACRNTTKAEEAATDIIKSCKEEENLGKIVVVNLDLSSFKSIRECAQKIIEHEEHIELLVNNAALFGGPVQVSEDGFEIHFATNHLGHFLFTLLLLPRMIKSKPSRIVNVSSLAHAMLSGNTSFDDLNKEKHTVKPFEAYCQSKFANILFTKELTSKLKEANVEGVTTYSVHPGAVSTDLQRHFDDVVFKGVMKIYNHLVQPFFKTPDLGAQTVIYCAVDDEVADETGLYYSECKVDESASNANKPEEATLLWNLSMKMVRLDEAYNPFIAN